jgi:hypothetical protein
MRRYLEQITNIATGSIYPNFYTMNFSLLSAGFKGESHTGDSVFIFKAHHPFLFSQTANPRIHKALVCVRNPYDVIVSYMQLRLTQTHTKSCEFTEEEEIWAPYVRDMARLWNEYNAYSQFIELVDFGRLARGGKEGGGASALFPVRRPTDRALTGAQRGLCLPA